MTSQDSSFMPYLVLFVGMSVAILALIFIGVLGGTTFGLVQNDIAEIGLETPYNNDTFTALSGSASSLSNTKILSIVSIIANNGSDQAILSSNFTLDASAGTLTLNTDAFNNTEMNATYTYRNASIQNDVNQAIISSFDSLEKTGSYVPLVILAVVIMLVLGLVMGAGMMKSGGSKGAL